MKKLKINDVGLDVLCEKRDLVRFRTTGIEELHLLSVMW